MTYYVHISTCLTVHAVDEPTGTQHNKGLHGKKKDVQMINYYFFRSSSLATSSLSADWSGNQKA